MKKGIFLAMASAAILSLSSCGSTKAAGVKHVDLESTLWKLESMNGEKKQAFTQGESFTLEFLAKEGRIAGVGACNRFMGSYTLEKDGKLDIKMGGATMMACPDMNLEQPYFNMLDQADTYKLEGGKLILYKGKDIVAVFGKYNAAADMHNAENSLDIPGVYKGTLPAADCPGIKTTLVLNKKSQTFSLTSEYIDKNVKFTDKGTYSVKGNILTLTQKDNSTSLYKIGENSLTMLNADGNVNTGELASMYVLTKQVKPMYVIKMTEPDRSK